MVYAPGVKRYKPIQLMMEASPDLRLLPLQYSDAKVLFLPAINESVPSMKEASVCGRTWWFRPIERS